MRQLTIAEVPIDHDRVRWKNVTVRDVSRSCGCHRTRYVLVQACVHTLFVDLVFGIRMRLSAQ